jgi:hypothetical protein
LAKIRIFKIANLLIGLGSLMLCTHDLTVLTKQKKQSAIVHHSDTVAKTLSTNIYIIITELVYLQKMDKLCP